MPSPLRLALLCFALSISSSLLSCTAANTDLRIETSDGQITIAENETLRIHLTSEPPSLDWTLATDTTSATITNNLMEGLTAYEPLGEPMKLIPALAESWSSSDNRTWTFKLRDDVYWTDGVKFTAAHVVDGWRRLLDPATASQYAYFLFAVTNARAFNESKVVDFSEVGVKAVSPTELVVTLDKPVSYFPSLLQHQSTFPVRMDLIRKFDVRWTDPENLVTLGPYFLRAREHDSYVLLERYEKYFRGLPPTKYVLGRVIEKVSTALRLYKSNQFDALETLPARELKQLSERKDFRSAPTYMSYFYVFDVNEAPTNNVHLRRAIAHAIDRSKITRLLGGFDVPTISLIPPGLVGYSEADGLPFDVEKAKASLKKAGYASPSEVPKISMAFNTNEDHKLIAENVQNQLSVNLGIQTELLNEEWKVYLSRTRTDPYPFFRYGWQADFPDPDNYMNLFASYSENNKPKWKNLEYDRLIEAAAQEGDEKRRAALYHQAQKLILQDAPIVPFYVKVEKYLIHERVKNYPINSLKYDRFYQVVLK